MDNTIQIGPRIDARLAEDYKWLVRQNNEGKYRGKLGDEVEHALALHMGEFFIENPDLFDPQELEETQSDERVERFGEYANRFRDTATFVHQESGTEGSEIRRMEDELEDLQAMTRTILREVLQDRDSGEDGVTADARADGGWIDE